MICSFKLEFTSNMLCVMNRQLYTICLRKYTFRLSSNFYEFYTKKNIIDCCILIKPVGFKKICHLIKVHFTLFFLSLKFVSHVPSFYLPFLETNLQIDKLFCWLLLTYRSYWKVVYFKVCRQNIHLKGRHEFLTYV